MTYTEFKHLFLQWFREQNDVDGIAIVGSYARGAQKPDSDIDAVIFCREPEKYIYDQSWVKQFGDASEVSSETWGVVQTIRVFFNAGLEIEFNFSTIAWADIPVDPGTNRVVSGGIEILHDPTGQLGRLKREVRFDSESGS